MGKAGRPKGTTYASSIKRKIQDYFTEEEVEQLIAELKVSMKKDNKLKLFVVEQLFGKAPQRIEMTGEDGKAIIIQIAKEVAEKNDINSQSSNNSI